MLLSLSAAAGDAPASEGLKAGTAALTFKLPVVNEFTAVQKPGEEPKKVARWGPELWTGQGAQEQKKLVILSFFATYCDPCKKEMPELSRLYDAYKDQGLGVMLVSIDKGDEEKKTIIDLASQNQVKFPVLHDRFQVVARRYLAERLPYMLMIDGAGLIKTVHVGYTDDLKANLENEVRGHLGMAPLPPPAPPAKETPKKTEAKKADKKGAG
jgi:thiol-disulfide isomerase/thioredoxin